MFIQVSPSENWPHPGHTSVMQTPVQLKISKLKVPGRRHVKWGVCNPPGLRDVSEPKSMDYDTSQRGEDTHSPHRFSGARWERLKIQCYIMSASSETSRPFSAQLALCYLPAASSWGMWASPHDVIERRTCPHIRLTSILTFLTFVTSEFYTSIHSIN